jgi:hypothetical protein
VSFRDRECEKSNGPRSENENALSSRDMCSTGSVQDDGERFNESRGFVGAGVRELVEVGDGVVEEGLKTAILVGEDLGGRVEAHWRQGGSVRRTRRRALAERRTLRAEIVAASLAQTTLSTVDPRFNRNPLSYFESRHSAADRRL